MAPPFPDIKELDLMARKDRFAFRKVPREKCLGAVRQYVQDRRADIRAHHQAGESGGATLKMLTELCDEVVLSVFNFALAHVANPGRLLQQTAICALGGYGRCEMSPHSDLDISLVFDSELDMDIETLNLYLPPFFWDLGFKAGYTLHSVADAAALAVSDPNVFTTYSQARLIHGDTITFGRLKLTITDWDKSNREDVLAYVRRREHPEYLPREYRDLYAPEPNIKENSGGLRDFHAGLWMIFLTHGNITLDDLSRTGHISSVEYLDLREGLDFIWRIRNELHFVTGRGEDRLTFPLQHHVATAFGYGDTSRAVARFMEDYYNAACKVRRFLLIAGRICDQPFMARLFEQPLPEKQKFRVYQQQLCIDPSDKNWFSENPARLMEVIWECARRVTPLSLSSAHWVSANLGVINDEFRSSDVVRRYFLDICHRPLQAGAALREAARTGVLGAYLPEFRAVQGIVRYEDFHSYPVDEHTLRALEALSRLNDREVALAPVLHRIFERIRDPHVLVLAILFHDLGKAGGETHVQEGVQLAREIMRRIGVEMYDADRIAFLVEHHMLMSDIAFYRNTDDLDVITAFTGIVKTDDLLRMLLLLTYADLMAVAPNVWNEWKGALLLKLFLKAERILTGRTEAGFDRSLIQPKLDRVRELLEKESGYDTEGYLSGLSERYLLGYSPEQIMQHILCLEEAKKIGLAVRCLDQPELGASEVVVCTRDRHGLFAEITGAFTSQLINVRNAALFTREDGWVVDSFLVDNAVSGRPLTGNEVASLSRVLHHVILEHGNVQEYVDKSRKRLFALARSGAAVKASVEYDNAVSQTDTVIDIVAGDRTGLLYDIARTLSEMGIDFSAAHIVTDVGRARDAFYVRMNGGKIEEEKLKEWVTRRLYDAIAGAPVPDKN